MSLQDFGRVFVLQASFCACRSNLVTLGSFVCRIQIITERDGIDVSDIGTDG